NPAPAQALELAVPPHSGETDAVIDLRDLVQRRRGVLRDEQHTASVLEHDDAPSPRNALPCELRTLAHQLLGGGVQRHRHWRWLRSARWTTGLQGLLGH